MPSKKSKKSKKSSINLAEEEELLTEPALAVNSSLHEDELLDATPPVKHGKRKKEKSVGDLDISLATDIVFEDAPAKPELEKETKKKKSKLDGERKSRASRRSKGGKAEAKALAEAEAKAVAESEAKAVLESELKTQVETEGKGVPETETKEPVDAEGNAEEESKQGETEKPQEAGDGTPTKTTGLSTPEMTPEKEGVPSPTTPKYASDIEEVDIYGELQPTTITESKTPDGEVTLDEVLQSTKDVEEEEKSRKKRNDKLLSDNEEEDLDYEDDQKEVPVQRISVVVGGPTKGSKGTAEGGGGTKKLSSAKKIEKTTIVSPPVVLSPPAAGPVILPPLPHTLLSIPPMLPLPPALPPRGRLIYINPKFKTEIIVRNLEEQGVLKGGSVAIHMNRRVHKRSRSRSPIKLSGNYEYVPSNISKLSDPATTLLVTDLSTTTSKSRIRELFSSAGQVREVLTYPSERRAVVTFDSAKDAVTCRRKFHKSDVDGSCVTVNFAL